MNGKAFAIVGIIAVGAIAVSRKAKAKPPSTIPDEQVEFPDGSLEEPLPPESGATAPGGSPAEDPPGGNEPGAGSGAVTFGELIPEPLKHVDLSGKEEYHFNTVSPHGFLGIRFYHWTITDSLNGLPIQIFRGETNADDWISFFTQKNPTGSDKHSHSIIFKISPTASEQHREWMKKNIAGL